VSTGQEKKNEAGWALGIDAKTKIVRDKTTVTFEQARIRSVNGSWCSSITRRAAMKALEIRLAAQ
jgi:hypothetical protein